MFRVWYRWHDEWDMMEFSDEAAANEFAAVNRHRSAKVVPG